MQAKKHVTHDRGLDNTIDLLNEGYMFIKNRVEQYKSDIFETHLIGQKVICMTGEEAAKIFYDPELFYRNGATPKRVQKTLFGVGAIQSLDGEEQIHRKKLFMSLMTASHQKQIAKLTMDMLQDSIKIWENKEQIVLFDEVSEILCRAVCQWAGVPLKECEVKERAEDFTIEIMKASLDFLVNKIEYDVPNQNLSYSMKRMPTLPESKFIMSNIRRKS